MHLRLSDLIDRELLIVVLAIGLLFAFAILAGLAFSGHLTPYWL